MAAWSQTPNDLLSLIGNKLDVVADRCRFRSVCKSWRCSLPPFAQPPFLMLSEPSQEKEDNKSEEKVQGKEMVNNVNRNPPPLRRFVSIGGGGGEQQQQMVYEIDLPEAHQHRCVGSAGNWLITTDKSGMMYLLNPFSKNQINLPPQSTFEYGFRPETEHLVTPEDRRDFLLSKVIISSTPSPYTSNSTDCIAMAIHHGKRKLAVARLGDTTWTTVQTPLSAVEDVIFFKEQFYAVTYRGILMVCDIGLDLDSSKALLLTEILPKATVQNKKYLVELLGELLLIIKFVYDLDIDDKEAREKNLKAYKTEMFEVYKLDFTNRKWKEVNNLGKYCLFLGFNTSVSVLADNYFGLQGNCIYFTDDYTIGYRGIGIPGGKDMGVFNLEDKSIQPHYKGESTSYYSSPIWLVPTPVK